MILRRLFIIEKWLFVLFLFCIPFQVRWIFYRSVTPSGRFDEWSSFFLYPTDILVASLLVLCILRLGFDHREFFKNVANRTAVIFWAISIISITQSHYPAVSVYQAFKITEFLLLYWYVVQNFQKISSLFSASIVLILSGLVQAAIALGQYISQSSLGLRLLGESKLVAGGYGVASFVVDTQLYLRAYGTLPHPNVLATFLLISIFAFFYWYFKEKNTSRYFLFAYAIMLLGLFASYSRAVVAFGFLAGIVMLVVFLSNKNTWKDKKRFKNIILVTAITAIMFGIFNQKQIISRLTLHSDDESVSLRLYYNRLAGQGSLARPLLGSGIGTFVSEFRNTFRHLPDSIYQPVHNIYFLIATETGLVSLAVFLLFFVTLFKNNISKKPTPPIQKNILIIATLFLLVGVFDHFLWTLQQGRILFWLILALLQADI